jgi:hypothetical protein
MNWNIFESILLYYNTLQYNLQCNTRICVTWTGYLGLYYNIL